MFDGPAAATARPRRLASASCPHPTRCRTFQRAARTLWCLVSDAWTRAPCHEPPRRGISWSSARAVVERAHTRFARDRLACARPQIGAPVAAGDGAGVAPTPPVHASPRRPGSRCRAPSTWRQPPWMRPAWDGDGGDVGRRLCRRYINLRADVAQAAGGSGCTATSAEDATSRVPTCGRGTKVRVLPDLAGPASSHLAHMRAARSARGHGS